MEIIYYLNFELSISKLVYLLIDLNQYLYLNFFHDLIKMCRSKTNK